MAMPDPLAAITDAFTSFLFGKVESTRLPVRTSTGQAQAVYLPTAAPGLKEAWTATKPAITSVPCIAFQVNEKITIEPLPATTADATAMIAKYREGT